MIRLSRSLWAAYPQAGIGFLVMRGVSNPERHPALEQAKETLQASLRARYAGQDRKGLEKHPILQAYATYYHRYKKTYHVALQLESLLNKGAGIPSTAALVEAMFMAELENLLLTAGHDLDQLDLPVHVGIAAGSERYITLRGEEQQLKPGDMFMADRQGVISSILYGPDQRTRLRPETRSVLFAVYAPPGIGQGVLYDHLRSIQNYVEIVTPEAVVKRMEIYTG